MEKLKFRKYDNNSIDDRKFINEIFKDSAHEEYFGKESTELIKSNSDKLYDNMYIFINDDNEKVGYVEISDCIHRDDFNTVTLYYSVLPKFRGNKYGSLMIKLITEYIFSNTDVNNIVMNIDPSNMASIKTVKIAGYSDFIDYDDEIQFFRRK